MVGNNQNLLFGGLGALVQHLGVSVWVWSFVGQNLKHLGTKPFVALEAVRCRKMFSAFGPWPQC